MQKQAEKRVTVRDPAARARAASILFLVNIFQRFALVLRNAEVGSSSLLPSTNELLRKTRDSGPAFRPVRAPEWAFVACGVQEIAYRSASTTACTLPVRTAAAARP